MPRYGLPCSPLGHISIEEGKKESLGRVGPRFSFIFDCRAWGICLASGLPRRPGLSALSLPEAAFGLRWSEAIYGEVNNCDEGL